MLRQPLGVIRGDIPSREVNATYCKCNILIESILFGGLDGVHRGWSCRLAPHLSMIGLEMTMHRTVVYVDWDTARRLDTKRENTVAGIERSFEKIRCSISRSLAHQDAKAHFRVYWRIYHGWHAKNVKTEDRRLFEKYASSARSATIDRVSFSTDFIYSGDALCGSHRVPVFDTLRYDRVSGVASQKMVDTMLACDLLHLARTKEYSYHIVVADDDDALPAIMAAEAWRAKVFLLHRREHLNKYLNLEGIAQKMEFV